MDPLRYSLFFVLALILSSCSSGSDTTLYDVSVSVAPEGSGAVSPVADSSYEDGSTINLQVSVNDEYLFAGWTGDLESNENPLSLTVDQHYNLTANFEIKNYELTVNIEGEGTVSEEVMEQKSKEFAHGSVVELTANAAEGYRFVKWQGDLTGSENPAQVTVDDPKIVTAVFEKKSYDLTVSTEGEGSISEEVVQAKAKEYDHGTVVELTASPAEGWGLVEWTGAVTGSDNPVQLTVDGPREVTAVFEKTFYVASNGITVKCPVAEIGDTGTVNGVTYTKRSAGQITPENAKTTCTSGITDMSSMFRMAESFNGDLSSWDVSSVTDMNAMFAGTKAFNGDISSWDVSSVTDMGTLFYEAESFNGELSDWDVSSVTNMSHMFRMAESFNGDLSSWDVSSVTDMGYMFFYASSFNGDISSWKVDNVTRMSWMFYNASSFNQDLSGWCVSNINEEPENFSNESALSDEHHPVWGSCPQ